MKILNNWKINKSKTIRKQFSKMLKNSVPNETLKYVDRSVRHFLVSEVLRRGF